MHDTVARGLLVVFEGPEGVGKTTQVARLVDRLASANIPVVWYREPGGTPLGDAIRGLLLHEAGGDVNARAEALLYMAARAQLVQLVRERVEAGTVVLLDRFFLSTYAYQIAGRQLPDSLVRDANALAVDGVVPDLTLLLTCDPDVARARMVARGKLDRLEREEAAFHDRVADAFRAALDPAWMAAHPEVGPVASVDAAGSPDEVGARVEAALKSRWRETFKRLGESL